MKNRLGKGGFTMLEALLALYIVMITLLLLYPCMQAMQALAADDRENDDMSGMQLLRRELVIAQTYTVDGEVLVYRDAQGEHTLEVHDKRLVKRPGYEIFLTDIEEGYFYEDKQDIWFAWKRGKRSYQAIVAWR